MSAGAGKVETSLARQCWEHPPFFVMLFFGNRERAALRTLLYHVDSAGPAASHLLPCLARELNSRSRLAVMSATTSLEWALECLCHAADANPAAWPQVYMYILAVASSYTNRHIKNTVWIMPVRDPLTVLHHATPRELVTVIDSPPHARSTQSDPCSTQHVNYLPAGIRLRMWRRTTHWWSSGHSACASRAKGSRGERPVQSKKNTSCSLRRALLMPKVHPGSLYRRGRRT